MSHRVLNTILILVYLRNQAKTAKNVLTMMQVTSLCAIFTQSTLLIYCLHIA